MLGPVDGLVGNCKKSAPKLVALKGEKGFGNLSKEHYMGEKAACKYSFDGPRSCKLIQRWLASEIYTTGQESA